MNSHFKLSPRPTETIVSKKQSSGNGTQKYYPTIFQEKHSATSRDGTEKTSTCGQEKKSSNLPSETSSDPSRNVSTTPMNVSPSKETGGTSQLTSTTLSRLPSPLKFEPPLEFMTAKQLLEAEGKLLAPVPTISFGCPHTGEKADTSDTSPQFHLCKHCELWFCRGCMPKHRMKLFQAFETKQKNERDQELWDLLFSFY
jgi:hypothetical protein